MNTKNSEKTASKGKIKEKFKRPEKNPLLGSSDYVNIYYPFTAIFEGEKNGKIISQTEVEFPALDGNGMAVTGPTFILDKENFVQVLKPNKYGLEVGVKNLTKFMLLTAV